MELLPMAYHLNGSVRGKLAITEDDLNRLSEIYDYYVAEVKDRIETFVLPQGSTAACILHTCRSEAKKSVRALHKVSTGKGCAREFFLIMLICLPMYLFVMAVYVNKQLGVEEIPFISKSYPTKTMKKKTEE